ncbi:MFS transporter [Streptomyces qinglanensis]|uniref:Nitrate/nitrite transporter NarK n=1 Tax=Streptomyces qinglanensis TaxID=943816 RepID=A0A1H9TLK4_9ACTN|nr:MFS transporter [Streptomyces qinglanensis]SER97917.1 Nitrate/nitrite transporter NarK [Streptomyces qinglanensis]
MHRRQGSDLGRLWRAYAVSTYGTWVAFGAFHLIAVQVLRVSAFAVSLLDAAGLALAACVAVPLGPWTEYRTKRPVMIATDLLRFTALASVPLAYLTGVLSYGHLLVVSVVCGTAGIAFTAASGAYLKHLVDADRLLTANGRFEGTNWLATAAGPPLGGMLVALFGPVVTVTADALSHLLSALGLLRIRGADTAAPRTAPGRLRAADLASGWRVILHDRVLRRLFLNSMAVNGLIMATGPLLAVLLLGRYHFPAWQYGLAFGVPALGGFVGARLSAPLAARYGRHRVLLVSGWLRALFPVGLALTRPGVPGLVTVLTVEALLIVCAGVFNPLNTTERLQRAPTGRVAQVVSAWSISSKLAQAAFILAGGALGTLTGPLTAITVSGVLLLGTPLLLPRRMSGPESPSGEAGAAGELRRV